MNGMLNEPPTSTLCEFLSFNVSAKQGDVIRRSWRNEMGLAIADPGHDPRGALDAMPRWTVLDSTSEGRGTDWYPKLQYNLKENSDVS